MRACLGVSHVRYQKCNIPHGMLTLWKHSKWIKTDAFPSSILFGGSRRTKKKNIVSTAVQHRALHCARYRTDHNTLSVSGLTAHTVARPPLPLERPLYYHYQRALRTVARVKSTRKLLSRARYGAAGASGSYKLSLFNYFDNMVNRPDSPNKKKRSPESAVRNMFIHGCHTQKLLIIFPAFWALCQAAPRRERQRYEAWILN